VAQPTKIAFIGPGVMAEAMIAGLVRTGKAKGSQLVAAGPRPKRGAQLAEQYQLTFTQDNAEAAKQASVLVLCVKPQQLDRVLAGLKGAVRKEALVLSIVAGASTEHIGSALKHPAVVRAMPNTPARIGAGITVWTASPETSETQLAQAEDILSALGETVFMEDESFLDKATALSGTGPAYVFLFMEAMVDAGVHLGFPRRVAEQLVVETLRGSVEFYDQIEEGPHHLARLRNQVTSPGGTSAEALYYLEKAGFRTALSRAIWAAYERSRSLGHGNDPDRKLPK
jgi:pyrroline-5-carboxylate reductase